MMQYLLAAEADQIQDFIFRASHLQEVVGGSQLLSRFCREVPRQLLAHNQEDNIIISDGGKFLVVFDDRASATEFGNMLAEAYRRVADGTLTVAEPVPMSGNFGKASEEAEENLRKAKRCRWPTTGATSHFPYMAVCSSCGLGLAVTRGKLFSDDPTAREQYLCKACKSKAAERTFNLNCKRHDEFIYSFLEEVAGESVKSFDWTKSPEQISLYDPRRYVAYLVADGNDMGKVFSQCNKSQMRALSEQMIPTLRNCLATSTGKLKQQESIEAFHNPVLPLILGGDDVFALLPASWALSFSLDFCQTFHKKVGNLLNSRQLSWQPTVSAAVVICKETFPYRLAHQIGKTLLERAKHVAKACFYEMNTPVSVVDFEVIMGSQATMQSFLESNRRPTLRPYFVMPQESQSVPEKWGIPLERLLEQRWELRCLPRTRLAQLRHHFETLPQGSRQEWGEELKKLVTRIRHTSEETPSLQQALIQLGSAQEDDWLYSIKRKGEKDIWRGHGLPDLLNVWNFTFALNKQRIEYEE